MSDNTDTTADEILQNLASAAFNIGSVAAEMPVKEIDEKLTAVENETKTALLTLLESKKIRYTIGCSEHCKAEHVEAVPLSVIRELLGK